MLYRTCNKCVGIYNGHIKVMDKDSNKNLKDSGKDFIKDTSFLSIGNGGKGFGFISYTKTQKLITALYMVTEMIEKDEPIRNKLRNIGLDILSDIYKDYQNKSVRISEIMSFLGVAVSLNLVSEMNCNILMKEFSDLKLSLEEKNIDPQWLSDFMSGSKSIGHENDYKGHQDSARIGVQKGSTLMNALNSVNLSNRIQNTNTSSKTVSSLKIVNKKEDFDLIKKERRFNIISAIKNNNGSANIKDIKTFIDKRTGDDSICSEKTIQRELVSMIKDDVLDKEGEKRWSRYSVKHPNI